ncbi:MAG: uroporphyrinogen decarboxylase family protein [Armatimonadota bacterium]
MERQYYLDLAESGLRMPIGTDLVLHEYADPAAILENGQQLGMVLEQTARRYGTPLAVPHMDLELEKSNLLDKLGIPPAQAPKFHFTACPGNELFDRLHRQLADPLLPRLQAHIDSIAYIARHTRLLPIGMTIGPFSLMTKLVPDPITPIALAGAGITADDEEEIRTVERVLELGIRMIMHSIAAQIKAGAKAIFIAEPAANRVYLSPNQIEDGADIFDRYVMAYNRQIKAFLDEHDVDLIFHCCGELTPYMLQKFTELDPALLSLGSSRKLWEDAALVPKRTVLYGNLPSKKFYSDEEITVQEVQRQAEQLVQRMREVKHPFILGTECDVLSVPGCEETIQRKAAAILESRETVTVPLG